MSIDIAKELASIGGTELVESWKAIQANTPLMRLPSAELDGLSLGYAVAIGGAAAALDIMLDKAFRKEMHDIHRERSPEEQAALEKNVENIMEELGIPAGGDKGDPDTAMDWYRTLNDLLKLKDGFKLRPANHRILNHTDEASVIEMLMNGEAGFGETIFKIYPKMSYEAAKKIYDAHIAADRGTRQSLPLAFMTWFWEQSVKAQNPATAGEPNAIYAFLSKYVPNVDWSKWINKLSGEGKLIPEGATFGEAMLKLYETGMLNQREFWTSDLGAAVGGAKRRASITATMEVGVEIYAFMEGIGLSFISLNDNLETIIQKAKEWRDQPKYLDMRIAAQCIACSGGVARAALKGDILNINYFSIAMMMKHLWIYPRAQSRHYDRLISMSEGYRNTAISEFCANTGISIRPRLTLIEGGKTMAKSLDDRLHKAGCQSTRVRVLASRYPEKLEPLVASYEKLSVKADSDMKFQPKFDALCESWYLSKIEDDDSAIAQLDKDLKSVAGA
ncbi:hypothetical protein ACQCLI_12775 [Pseudomonas nitroreducens]|uniref:hypothetical protein n=1 Tax=Pseudomonas nitroreducens TaxID=46680 RepID=UPI003D02C1FE